MFRCVSVEAFPAKHEEPGKDHRQAEADRGGPQAEADRGGAASCDGARRGCDAEPADAGPGEGCGGVHELSIALDLLNIVSDAAAADSRATRVHVRVGVLSGLCPEGLEFAFRVASVGTIAEGAQLKVALVPVRMWCPSCWAAVETLPRVVRCARCRTPGETIVNGREVEIVRIDFDPLTVSDRSGRGTIIAAPHSPCILNGGTCDMSIKVTGM
ncbi:MAG: hydrogenase maturation nickel metallochaperone HypA [Micromonosporaceae bacterium]|nr:hydrogenase maturation nickel metallochaperone HypA [Micromonosporaceae bacterium]